MGSLIDKIDLMEKVAELHLKGWTPAQIGRSLEITPVMARKYIGDYQDALIEHVNENPDFLERVAENTLKALEQMDMLIKEAWETYDDAKKNDMIASQINLLKVTGDLQDKRNKLLQLMGARADGTSSAELNKAKRVNEIVSGVIRDVVSECPRCKLDTQIALAEAFALMNKENEAATFIPEEPEEEIVDVESEEMSEEDHKMMMVDVLSKD